MSKEISLVNLANILKCFLINLFLLICQMSVFITVEFKLSLFLFSSSHSNNKWSKFWSLVPQWHVGVSIILNRCKYDLILPCPITMDVTGHGNIRSYLHRYIHTYVHVCMYLCTYVCMYVCMHYVCIYVCMYICMHIYLCIYIYMYVVMYGWMYVCVYIRNNMGNLNHLKFIHTIPEQHNRHAWNQVITKNSYILQKVLI